MQWNRYNSERFRTIAGDRLVTRVLRFLFGIALIASLLAIASWAAGDCEVAPYVYDNCLWLKVRNALGLPQSKLLRTFLLETIGLSLLAGIYFAWRCMILRRTRPKDLPFQEAPRPH